MSSDKEEMSILVPSPSHALSSVRTASLAQRGLRDSLAAEEAKRWLVRGVELWAQHRFADGFACFERGLKICPQDPNLQRYVGCAYEVGHGVPLDHEQAAQWFRKAADQGLASAQDDLAFAFECGRGLPKDDDQAAFWYRKAADQGDADAQFMLAVMYLEGRGVRQNREEAVSWFRRSADQGDLGAQILLGELYETGEMCVNSGVVRDIVTRDYAQAASWYLKVAVGNDAGGLAAMAQCHLGRMYENGLGVPKDLEHAIHWYRRAAEQGNEDAKAALATLNSG